MMFATQFVLIVLLCMSNQLIETAPSETFVPIVSSVNSSTTTSLNNKPFLNTQLINTNGTSSFALNTGNLLVNDTSATLSGKPIVRSAINSVSNLDSAGPSVSSISTRSTGECATCNLSLTLVIVVIIMVTVVVAIGVAVFFGRRNLRVWRLNGGNTKGGDVENVDGGAAAAEQTEEAKDSVDGEKSSTHKEVVAEVVNEKVDDEKKVEQTKLESAGVNNEGAQIVVETAVTATTVTNASNEKEITASPSQSSDVSSSGGDMNDESAKLIKVPSSSVIPSSNNVVAVVNETAVPVVTESTSSNTNVISSSSLIANVLNELSESVVCKLTSSNDSSKVELNDQEEKAPLQQQQQQ